MFKHLKNKLVNLYVVRENSTSDVEYRLSDYLEKVIIKKKQVFVIMKGAVVSFPISTFYSIDLL